MKKILIFILILILITNILDYKENMTIFNCNKKITKLNNKNEITFECVEKLSLLKSLNNIFKKYKFRAHKEHEKQKKHYDKLSKGIQ